MRWFKEEIQKFLSKRGYAVLSGLGDGAYPYAKTSQAGMIRFAVMSGLTCSTVIDVGAGVGTQSLLENFKDCEFVLIEPNHEFNSSLELIRQNRLAATYIINEILSSREREVKFYLHKDKFGNTIFEEQEKSLNKEFSVRRAKSLDTVLSKLENKIEPPYFLKLDTQGSELEILQGAEKTLKNTEAILIEVSLHQFFIGGPLISDVILNMDKLNYRLLDIADLTYRPIDGKLAQLDCLFVKKKSELFSEKRYSNR